MGIIERSERRKKRIVANRAASFADAERWDLEFWQNQSPAQRLSALVAIRRDIQKVKVNIVRSNRALKDFGSPISIEPDNLDQIVQIGVAPDRIALRNGVEEDLAILFSVAIEDCDMLYCRHGRSAVQASEPVQ